MLARNYVPLFKEKQGQVRKGLGKVKQRKQWMKKRGKSKRYKAPGRIQISMSMSIRALYSSFHAFAHPALSFMYECRWERHWLV